MHQIAVSTSSLTYYMTPEKIGWNSLQGYSPLSTEHTRTCYANLYYRSKSPLLQQAFIPVDVKEASITVGLDANFLGEHAPRPHIHLQRRVLGQKGELTILSADFLQRFAAGGDRTSEDDFDRRQYLHTGHQYHAPCLRGFTHHILWSGRH